MKRVQLIYRTILFFISSFVALSLAAKEPRNFLQKSATVEQLTTQLLSPVQWVHYPDYTNRKGWDALTASLKDELIQEGNKNLNYTWKVIPATSYLEYEKSGSRTIMETPLGANNKALNALVVAELAEGQGRFIDQIINGVWQACDMSSWVASAHLPVQKTGRTLPDFHEQIIDLGSGDMGSFFAWTWYFFHTEFDKINPIISQRLFNTIQDRILIPYMMRDDYWWQALNENADRLVNNWNPWCNFNVLTCFLLLEDNATERAAAVYKTMKSVDQFINYIKSDGACEEGPSYWGHAAGKLYDYLQLLWDATNGKISLFNEPMIRAMGEYISRSYVGNNWVVNFADASAKGGGDAALIYRYGKAVQSQEMKSFAAYLKKMNAGKNEIFVARDFFRTIENVISFHEMEQEKEALPSVMHTWYPETEFCYIKNDQGYFFATKAGFNNESHNHNDVGTFSLYVDAIPFFIDAGVGTYTRQTFSNERYSIWTMQSDYHNVPKINGEAQPFGADFKATDVRFEGTANRFQLNLRDAYPAKAGIKNWVRTYQLAGNKLLLEDAFELSSLRAANEINFLTWAKPVSKEPGIVLLEKEGVLVNLAYDRKKFEMRVETIPLTDKRLSTVWGEVIYRVKFVAREMVLKGKYHFLISKAG